MRKVRPGVRLWVWAGVLLTVGIVASVPVGTQLIGLEGSASAAASTAGEPRVTPDMPFPTARPDPTAIEAANHESASRLMEKAGGGPRVSVVEGFDAAFVPEGRMAPDGVAAQRRTIFTDDDSRSPPAATADPVVVRQRETDIDLTFLSEIGAAGGLGPRAPARSLVLNLFRDVEFIAFLDRVEIVSTVGYAWVGTVAGVEGSLVIIGISDGVLTAAVDLGTAFYSVRPSGPGRYRISKVNRLALPSFAPPVPVQTQPGGNEIAADSGDVYDLLLLYTTAARANAGGTSAMNSLITAGVAWVNASYVASGIQTRCRLAAAVETGYAESGDIFNDLEVIQASTIADALRNQYAADVVSLLVSQDPQWGGVGYLMTQNDTSFAPWAYNVVVHYAWLPYLWSLGHEIGHNQGAHHEPGNGCPGLFPYSCGYTDFVNKFYTVMSYGHGCSGCEIINQFSSPTIGYHGFATGSTTQDNARTLNESRLAVANFREFGGGAAPGVPSGLTSSVSGSNIALGWTAPTTGGALTAYTIEAGSGPGLTNLANFSTGNTATTYATGGVDNGTYYVRVKATNSVGTSGSSNEVIMTVGCTSAPGAPSGLTLTQNSGGNVAFAWTAAAGGPTTYFIEAGSAPGLTDLANSDLGGTGTTFATGGVPAATYFVRVRAGNACGKSGASNEVTLIVH